MSRGPLYTNQLGLLYYTDTCQITSKLDADKGYRCVGTIDLDDVEYAKHSFSWLITSLYTDALFNMGSKSSDNSSDNMDICADARTQDDVRDFMHGDSHGLFIWILVPETIQSES